MPNLAALNQDTEVEFESPKDIIHRISESLLKGYTKAPLLDRYDMYQIIMNYWFEVMHDDVYFITQDGWPAANSLRELALKKGEKSSSSKLKRTSHHFSPHFRKPAQRLHKSTAVRSLRYVPDHHGLLV